MNAADIFNGIVNDFAAAQLAVAPKADTHRGWEIGWNYGRFTATGPNYDASWEGEEDGWVASGGSVEARTREDLIAEIDAYIEEHPADQA
jgi:hypothetical protein